MPYTIKDFLNIKYARNPSWSPDGSTISFLSNEPGTSQIFLISSIGGEPEQLTHYSEPVDFASFSPVDNVILFGMDEGGNERTQFYLLDLDTKKVRNLTDSPKIIHRFGGWSRDGQWIAYSSNHRQEKDFDVWMLNVRNGERRQVFAPGGWVDALGFSPHGKYVVARHSRSFVKQDLYLIEIDGGAKKITPGGRAEYGQLQWLPDENKFFIVSNQDRDKLSVLSFTLATQKWAVALDSQWEIDGLSISWNGQRAAVLTNENGYTPLKIYDTQSWKSVGQPIIPHGVCGSLRWSKNDDRLAIDIDASTHAPEIFMIKVSNLDAHRLTHSHQPVAEDVFVEPQLVTYQSFDGLNIPSWLYLPKNTSGPVPLVVMIHGGPEGQFQPSFAPVVQYFVSRGLAVIGPNVRGSKGYGKHFAALDDKRLRLDSVKDLVCLHKHIQNLPSINQKKVALMGGSYGGYMTLAGLAFFPQYWAAGVDIVGISHLVTFLEQTSVWRRAVREAEYGTLTDDRDFLESISPLNQVEKIQAPLLVIHGANDPRVPLAEAKQLVTKLQSLGRQAELLVYPDEGHGLSKLKNRLDAYPQVVAFLEQVLKL